MCRLHLFALVFVVEIDAEIGDVPEGHDALRVGRREQLVLVVAAEAENRLVRRLSRVEVRCTAHTFPCETQLTDLFV